VIDRHPTVSVDVGGVLIGSGHPIVVQSMTNTDTADADATALQVAAGIVIAVVVLFVIAFLVNLVWIH